MQSWVNGPWHFHPCFGVISDGILSVVCLRDCCVFHSVDPSVQCFAVTMHRSSNSPSWQFVGVIRAVQQISDAFNRQSHAFYVHRKGGAQTYGCFSIYNATINGRLFACPREQFDSL